MGHGYLDDREPLASKVESDNKTVIKQKESRKEGNVDLT
jgi:hypothetical protein